jgi:hypothetical protein
MIKTLALAAALTRPSPKIFLTLLLSLTSLAGSEAYGRTPDSTLREKDVVAGEKILARLREFEQAQQQQAAALERRQKTRRKISGELFVQAAAMRPSDLKTDLTTALFLYDEAFRESVIPDSGAALDCEGELREVYARLCRENRAGSRSLYLEAKARLHTRWAGATINDYRGAGDGATVALLEEMRSERQNDVRFAGLAVKALKSLEGEVYDHSTLAEFEEQRRLSRVPFERLSADVSNMLERVDAVLLSLPRGRLFYPLYHARNAYADGLFWWRKTDKGRGMAVDVNSLNEPAGAKSYGLDPDTLSYTVAISWRKAIRHTREALRLVELNQS